MPTILIVDDDHAVCASLSLLLKRSGYQVHTAQHPNAAQDFLEERLVDLLLLDMNFTVETSGQQGLHFLRKLQEAYPHLPVVLMTGWGTIQLAVAGMKAGARDFITKPWDNQQLRRSIKTILDLQQWPEHTKATPSSAFRSIIGDSEALQQVIHTASRVSATQASVLISGESGTGKELIAEAIHYASLRAGQPFVKVNLGGAKQ